MSKAGIQSNRGDGYQTLVAFGWALTILSDPDYQWLEVDSVTLSVDDVVIGKIDGTKIGCQCKKNQTQHRAWSFTDLKDELCKAISLLATTPKAEVRFYSRSNFGELAALREFSNNYANDSDYQANLTGTHQKTDTKLAALLVAENSVQSSYQFLQRTRFEVSPELDSIQRSLRERLRNLVSNHSAAYNALWTRLDYLGMREDGDGQNTAPRHRLTKEDLKTLLEEAGSMLTPSMDMMEVRTSFTSTSAIGRSWRRDISNERIPSPVTNELIKAIEAKHGSILLTGSPGSGKTCVMLAVQDELEQLAQNRTDMVPLFIQSREFADMVTAQDRQAQGLPQSWVEKAARMAEDTHVIVMIDSLDVLSIAREHSVLTYFLAQIDRLLLVPNITVVTACRDFDSHYDRRIAQRSWDKKIMCQPLSWNAEIAPLLTRLDIDSSAIDATTRELICNPRELALFVELAQQGGSFNVVTSQELAQRYLDTIVKDNSALGDTAMQAIEDIASEMLISRSLTVPYQRFTASQDIQRLLLSNRILHETQDRQLTFGHQTLLDVLVISRAVRQAMTLNEFIKNLPPVPFVRPSIRSFVRQLATRDRRDFRKQLRTVLTGNHAFHIRRLVAESFAEQLPHADDWPLLRDLRNQHPEVFQVIYTQAAQVQWHYFWMKHLVPILRDVCDVEGLTRHAHRIFQWQSDDPADVLNFWAETLPLDLQGNNQLANRIAYATIQAHTEHLVLYRPLLVELLKLPRLEHGSLGHALAYCVTNGVMDDTALWHYITEEVSDEDVLSHGWANKLHCQAHEFGNNKGKFLLDRMQESTSLLDLAIASIEKWSQVQCSIYDETPPPYWHGFLHDTSYQYKHTENGFHQYQNNDRPLFDAVEAAIVHHANTHSTWWQSNRERLCFNTEGSLRYFAILACTTAPILNLDVIGRLLCDKTLLESDLSYEFGTLMQTAFLHLDSSIQNAIQATVLSVFIEYSSDVQHRVWMLEAQAQLILSIPCHLRTFDAQTLLDECEQETWPLLRQPNTSLRGGFVRAPFSFEVFLYVSDDGVLRLLNHYDNHERSCFDDLPIGGKSEVSRQLQEAASRAPARFIDFLSANWDRISDSYRDNLMDGIATYLAHRYGNLKPNGDWLPIEKPRPAMLAQQIINELEKHPRFWHHNRAAAKAIRSCAHVALTEDAARLVALATQFSKLQEMSYFSNDSMGLLTTGINMARGNAAEALMILANQLEQNNKPWPERLPNALRLFAINEHPAIRALLLSRLPHFQSHSPKLGWELFGLAIQENAPGLWTMAEPCFYHAYHHTFESVSPWLELIYREGHSKDFEIWGRISALAALSNKLNFSDFLAKLNALKSVDAWHGAASVWTNINNIQRHREPCLIALKAGLNTENLHAVAIARELGRLFDKVKPLIFIPIELVRNYFHQLEKETDSARGNIFGFDAWLSATSLSNPIYALEATEIYFGFVARTKAHLYDSDNNLTQLLTRLFAQAEEQEESDSGAMLQRVVGIQDSLLTLGVNGVNDWLKAAERP